jgi:hypothetical protein
LQDRSESRRSGLGSLGGRKNPCQKGRAVWRFGRRRIDQGYSRNDLNSTTEHATAFTCFRCGESKKSKLITIYSADWSKRICNGCYGRLLSIYEIKAGTAPDDRRAEELAAVLLSSVTAEDQREGQRIFRASEKRLEYLSPNAASFVTTAEFFARQLPSGPYLEWSLPVMDLCKAIEAETVHRVIEPLARQCADLDLAPDEHDEQLHRMAVFCIDPSRNPPELGAFAYFLRIAVHSQKRRTTSKLLGAFFELATDWVGSDWLLRRDGLLEALNELTAKFRNRAAHIDVLSKDDYVACRGLVIGSEGMLWRLILATARQH